MQIPGVDYTEKFSPIAQPTSVRVVLVMVLWFYWDCDLVDVEAAFLEGKLTNSTYIELLLDLVELGFIDQKDTTNTCIELNGDLKIKIK